MAEHGHAECRPRVSDPEVRVEELFPLTSGYIQRSKHMFPKQGSKLPWKLYQNYLLDLVLIGYGRIDDGAMQFSTPAPSAAEARTPVAA